jgi:hypothetical protein
MWYRFHCPHHQYYHYHHHHPSSSIIVVVAADALRYKLVPGVIILKLLTKDFAGLHDSGSYYTSSLRLMLEIESYMMSNWFSPESL